MSKTNPDTVFVWQGDWDRQTKEDLDEQINELIASANLILVPNNESIEEVLSVADAFILSSREDPLPTVAFEAWSLGVPVTAFAGTGGIASLISKNKSLGEIASSMSARSAALMLEKVLGAKSDQRAQERKDWVESECNWPAYVYKLIHTLFDLPSVEVGLIGHNHGKYAQEAINSLLVQSLPAAQVTYFDVASTDKSKIEITTAVKQTAGRVDFVELPSNDGKLNKTWYDIAKKSTAEFIYFLEADDSVSQYFLEQGVNLLRGNPKAGLVFSDVSWVNEQGETIVQSYSKYIMETFGLDISSSAKISPEQALNSDFMVKNGILSVSSVIFRRSVLIKALEKAKNNLNKVNFAFDWVLYATVTKLGFGFIYFPGQVVKHRQHSNSLSSKKNHRAEILSVYRIIGHQKFLEEIRTNYLKNLL
jgi:glycosyltransferase involved in cell wall biosynthesis